MPGDRLDRPPCASQDAAAFLALGDLWVIDLRPVLFVSGVLICVLAGAMLAPALVDYIDNDEDWLVFVASAAICLFIGLSLAFANQGASFRRVAIREMFLMTTAAWLLTAAAAALPFAFSEAEMSYTDAFFEAMSGITTTGATVMTNLEDAPRGLLLWRALLQWLGGVGIIVMGMLILPALQVGGMQLFRTESSDRSEKALPRTAQNAAGVAAIYLLFTALCAIGYLIGGMDGFDAIAHAMTTVSTGGYGTRDASMGAWDSPMIHWNAVLFMIVGALPFLLFFRTFRGAYARTRAGEAGALFRDSQTRWFFAILLAAITALAIHKLMSGDYAGAEPAIRQAAFNVVSVMTGTGYATSDYGAWGGMAPTAFFFLMFVGGCAGSTSCGIKIFRFQVLFAWANVQAQRLLQPHGVFVAYYNGRPMGDEVAGSVTAFVFLFMLCFAGLTVLMGMHGLDFITAASAAASALANVGPGLGPMVGPATTFQDLPDTAKWALAAGMLLGRLELFTVFVMLSPNFWRN